MLRVISDPRAPVTSWQDVYQLAEETTYYLADEDTSEAKEARNHLLRILSGIVDHAQKLAPTYTNPPPFE